MNTANWQSRETIAIKMPSHRLYREEQLDNTGLHEYVSPSKIRAYINVMLENYLYIDEVQEWLMHRMANYERQIGDFSDVSKGFISMANKLPNNNELDAFRLSIIRLLL